MPTPARSLMTLEEMPGWLTFGEAATELGVSVERVRQLATSGKLKTARRVGRRPIGLVREAEIMAEVARRKAVAEESAAPPVSPEEMAAAKEAQYAEERGVVPDEGDLRSLRRGAGAQLSDASQGSHGPGPAS